MNLQRKNTLVISLGDVTKPTENITICQFVLFVLTLIFATCICALVAFPTIMVRFLNSIEVKLDQFVDGGVKHDMGADDQVKYVALKECARAGSSSTTNSVPRDELHKMIEQCIHVL